MKIPNTKKILNVKVDFGLNKQDVTDIIRDKLLKDSKNYLVSTTNAEYVVDAQNDKEFMDIINNSLISVPDGIGLIYAEQFQDMIKAYKKNSFYAFRVFFSGVIFGIKSLLNKNLVKGRVVGRELVYDLCEMASKNDLNVFFLGGWMKDKRGNKLPEHGDLADKASQEMKKLYPGLKVIGASSNFSYKDEDDEKTLKYINKCMIENDVDHIDILFVAYNHIRQEKWINRNRNKIPARISLGVGGTFDYICGSYNTSPKVINDMNLEWLYKLIMQPWRFRRIIKAFPIFPLQVFFNSLKKVQQNS